MVTSDQKPVVLDITRARGDDFSFTLTFTNSAGTPMDTDLYDWLLTVDPSSTPGSPGNNLFQLIPVASSASPPDGKITINLTLAQADQVPATYFHDIQRTLTGSPQPANAVRSIAKGKWIVKQDITK